MNCKPIISEASIIPTDCKEFNIPYATLSLFKFCSTYIGNKTIKLPQVNIFHNVVLIVIRNISLFFTIYFIELNIVYFSCLFSLLLNISSLFIVLIIIAEMKNNTAPIMKAILLLPSTPIIATEIEPKI